MTTSLSKSRPRGIRNNNPGNIRFDGTKWRGLRGSDGAFCIFETPDQGIRAMAKIIGTYARKGVLSIEGIITRWAPPNENNTEAYIASVCSAMRRDRMHIVLLDDYPDLITAIIHHENGQQPYSREQIVSGIAAAL